MDTVRPAISREAAPRIGWAAVQIALAAGAVATAVWLAGASIHVVDWRRTVSRVAVFPRLRSLVVAVGTATAVVAALVLALVRRDRRTMAAAATVISPLNLLWVWVVPFLPWLPDRLPLLLVLGGPARWVVGGVAVGAAAARAVRLRSPRSLREIRLPGRRAVFALSLVLYAAIALRSFAVVGLSGDEPHYLIITHSLAFDHDLKIDNNHANRDYRRFYPGELRPDYLRRGLNGAIYSSHGPGLPALLVPGYLIAGAQGAMVTIALLAALAALAIFDVALFVASRPAAWATWIAVCLTVPFVPHAWSVFPDIAGAAIVAWTVRWFVVPGGGSVAGAAALGCAIGLLPWLHMRYLPLLVGLTLCAVALGPRRLKIRLALVAPIVVLVTGWLATLYTIYGSLDPRAQWGGGGSNPILQLSNLPRGVLGFLFDQKFGLLVYAPVYAVTAIGARRLWLTRGWKVRVVSLLAVAAGYVATCAEYYVWWGGLSAPARFLVAIVPLVAPFVAAGIQNVAANPVRAIVWPAVAASVLIGVVAIVAMDRQPLVSDPHGSSALVQLVQGSVPAIAALPTFTEPDSGGSFRLLVGWLMAALGAGCVLYLLAFRLRASATGSAAAAGFVLLFLGAVFTPPFAPDIRADTIAGNRIALMQAFDPDRRWPFDYARRRRMTPAEWLSASVVMDDRIPTRSMALPPGRYRATVWFTGGSSRPGDLEFSLGRGAVARLTGPLPNPATVDVDLPLPIPAVWLALTDDAAAHDVVRTQVAPLEIVPRADRPDANVRAARATPGRLNGYVAFVDDHTFPEPDAFWTRGVLEGRVLVATAGARRLVLRVAAGPTAETARVTTPFGVESVPLARDETRSLSFDIPADERIVPVAIKASASFRPVDVDPQSSDGRSLGCRVFLDLE